jgi:hypothetical protein
MVEDFKIAQKLKVGGMRGLEEKEAEAFRFKTTHLAPILSGF